MIEDAAFRNSSLQGAYLILAARALGIDTGPMSGIDKAKIDEAFFAGTAMRTNFVCSLGYGDPEKIFAAQPASVVRRSVPHRMTDAAMP